MHNSYELTTWKSEYYLSTLLHVWGRWNGLHLEWSNFNSSSRVWTGQLSVFAKALSQPEPLVHHPKCNHYNSFSSKWKRFFYIPNSTAIITDPKTNNLVQMNMQGSFGTADILKPVAFNRHLEWVESQFA